MKMYQNKITILRLTVISAMLFVFAQTAAAQQLKPKDIIYSRLPTDVTAAPTGANSPTIWAVGQNGANDRKITVGTQPRISDDGRFLLFKRVDTQPYFAPYGGRVELWIRVLATGAETKVLGPVNFDEFVNGFYFTPKSNQGIYEIIYSRNETIYKMNLDGTNPVQLDSGGTYNSFPVLKRDDSLIAFENFNNSNNAFLTGILTQQIDGTNRQKVPNTNFGDANPSWSNDGQFIAYGATYSDLQFDANTTYAVTNLFKIKPDGTGKTQLTHLAADNSLCREDSSHHADCVAYGMVWNEDNTKIFAAARIGNVGGLYAFNTDGSGVFTKIALSAGNAPDFIGGIVQTRQEQSLISNGGGLIGDSSAGYTETTDDLTLAGQYSMDSSIGEPIIDDISGGNFNFSGGFQAAIPLAPTAAGVEVSGRVLSTSGRGLSSARVILIDNKGTNRTVLSSSFGYFRFDEVRAGETYIVRVTSKRFTFAPQVVNLTADLSNLTFTAQ